MVSVLVFIVVPVIFAQTWRTYLLKKGGEENAERGDYVLQPASLIALLLTLILLFGFQGGQIIDQPFVILLLAVPILIQVYLNAGILIF